MSLLIRRARILTLAPPKSESGAILPGGRRGAALRDLGVIARGDVLVQDGKIAAVGPDLPVPTDAETIEADGRVLMPGFVDCHTHSCWAGDVSEAWEREVRLAPEKQPTQSERMRPIVQSVRDATRKQLAAALRTRLDRVLAAGTTTIEIKSGFGLTIDAELKQLHAVQRAAQDWPGTVTPTALLGHALDGDSATYTRMVVREMLPAVWHEFPGITVDARCAADAWPVEACVRLFERARNHGLPIRVTAEEHAPTGIVAEALKLHARSIDHLESASKNDLVALAAAHTFAVMTPAAAFHSRGRYGRAGAFVDSGGLLALASDYGPLTAPTYSMPFVLALAVRYCGLTPAEAIVVTTVNAAAALGLSDRGTVETGKRADLILLRHRDERSLAYEFGDDPVDVVIAAGRVIRGPSADRRKDASVDSPRPDTAR